MRVLSLIHEEDAATGLFGEILRERGDEILEWNATRGAPPEPADFDALVILGGSMHVDQEDRHPWLAAQNELIRAAVDRAQPLLGICLGSQLIAQALGARVGPASRPEIGWFEVELTPEGVGDPVLGSLPRTFSALEWHAYAFEVPPRGELLARNDVCAQGFRVGESTWGVQFHPETTRTTLESWRASSEGSAPAFPLDPIERWNELGRRLANAFFDVARGR
jgi:GMP synthase (glutamine-hydrolysing)